MTKDYQEINSKELDYLKLDQWGFDQWQQLYLKDPALYERCREQLLNQHIDNAPDHQKERLKGILFTMGGEKRRSRSIESEQARYTALMLDSLSELNEQISSLFDLNKTKSNVKNTTAKVLEFKNKNKC